jgi:hypothetical protein
VSVYGHPRLYFEPSEVFEFECVSGSGSLLFTPIPIRIWIRIQLPKIMRIRPDPDRVHNIGLINTSKYNRYIIIGSYHMSLNSSFLFVRFFLFLNSFGAGQTVSGVSLELWCLFKE